MPDLSDLITVLVVTSPTASDPSTETIDAALSSVWAHEPLARARTTIGADGVRPEQRDLAVPYATKLADIRDTMPIVQLQQWGHQANVMRMLLDHVTTPLVLLLEHDTPLLPAQTCPIDWQGCAQTIIDGELDLLRFHHESHVLPEHEHLMIGDDDGATRRIPYLRTVQWSQRPHLARTDWYRKQIAAYFSRSSRTMIEDVMFGVVHSAFREEGPAAWNRWKLALYADPEPTMQRSYHLDGRAGGEKYEMLYAYPGDSVPEYAPAPTLARTFE